MFKWLQQRLYKKPYEVSIIIPTYDNVEFLIECISSVVTSASKCCEYEVLLGIDNCKKTLQFIGSNKLFKNNHIKIYYFPKNVGPYIVRNSLANIAKHDNILFFDSDDVLMSNAIQTLMNRFHDKEILKYKFYNFHNGKDYNDVENLSLSNMFSHGSFLIKKNKFIEMNGFFGWRCGADTEFDERCMGINQRIYKLDVPLFYRRYHGKNVTMTPETGIDSKIRKKYGEFIQNRQLSKKWNNPECLEVFNFNLIKT